MDDLDRASNYEQLLAAAAIATACTLASEPIRQSAVCLNCGNATQYGRRWCDAECRADFEKISTRL